MRRTTNKVPDCVMILQSRLQITKADAYVLRKAAMTLHRWYEGECGDSDSFKSWMIVRDEETEKPYREVHPYAPGSKSYRLPIPDREKSAQRAINRVLASYPHLLAYHQTDPRGAPLYIIPRADLGDRKADECYNSCGVAVYR